MQSFKVGMVDTSKILQQNGKCITDHKLPYCDIPYKKPKTKRKFISYISLKNLNCDAFIDLSSNISWGDMVTMKNFDDITDLLTKFVHDECAPTAEKRKKF